ncbi:Sulfatase [Methylobrevis pamukkalensis]|uniref:Sulfatase n=2 Tax=Methylobrevis pamukkalensis TaxID=1439726 RepID=A0A1E3H2Q6_9HYPH|nr:Sulfatase [Methylobrevis pamukkalensis]
MAIFLTTVLFLFWFALSWRPVFAAASSIVTLVIVTYISNFKYDVLFEPLSFADFCLVPQILRHPDLYYARFLYEWPFWSGVAALLASILLWFVLEPSVIPDFPYATPIAAAGGILAFLLSLYMLRGMSHLPPLARALRTLAPEASIREDTARFGLYGGMCLHIVRWLATPPGRETPSLGERNHAWAAATPTERPARPPLVIVIQSESFLDLHNAGYAHWPLQNLERARRRAEAHGRLVVPTSGAWTMRTEYSFLTGRNIQSYRFDALDPYLRAAFRAPETAAQRLAELGYRAAFIHPFDIRFFQRHRLYPRFGFSRIIEQAAFEAKDRYGYYISDRAVTDRIIELIDAAEKPTFIYCVTMENHNPWRRGRLPHIKNPLMQYKDHLRNADEMLGRVIERLDALDTESIVCFYGDHVPIMRALAHPFPDNRTNYVILRCGAAANARRVAEPPQPQTAGVEDLMAMILKML